jgi:hypothetical protein
MEASNFRRGAFVMTTACRIIRSPAPRTRRVRVRSQVRVAEARPARARTLAATLLGVAAGLAAGIGVLVGASVVDARGSSADPGATPAHAATATAKSWSSRTAVSAVASVIVPAPGPVAAADAPTEAAQAGREARP